MIIVNGHKIDVAEYAPAGSRRLAENAVRSGRDPGCGGRGEDAGTVHASFFSHRVSSCDFGGLHDGACRPPFLFQVAFLRDQRRGMALSDVKAKDVN